MYQVQIDSTSEAVEAPDFSLLCHDVRAATGGPAVARKGSPLSAHEVRELRALADVSLHLAVPEPGDLGEDEAVARLAAAVAGDGVRVGPARFGQAPLLSDRRGLVRIDRERLDQVNTRAGVLAMTAPLADVPVAADTPLAVVKCAPLFLDQATIAAVEQIGAAIHVAPFVPRRGVFVAPATRVRGRALQLASESLSEALAWFGSSLDRVLSPAGAAGAIAAAFGEAVSGGAELILAAGASATDPADVVFEGLALAGGSVEQIGIPAEPGTACWIGQLQGVPVLGLASCELFGRPGALDLLLPRLLAGEPLDRSLLRRLAYGGLLLSTPPPLPPYRVRAD